MYLNKLTCLCDNLVKINYIYNNRVYFICNTCRSSFTLLSNEFTYFDIYVNNYNIISDHFSTITELYDEAEILQIKTNNFFNLDKNNLKFSTNNLLNKLLKLKIFA